MGDERLVMFAGAGASTLPPSSLPSWTQFNTFLLESLCDRLAELSRGRQPTGAMLAAFRARRDQTAFFAPDFQAQLIEEEIGSEYFRVWQSLQTSAYGPVHAALAELAAQDALAAIVTPNFDRLVETALTARGVPFEVFHDAGRFGALPQALDRAGAALPVIKIHGSIEDVSSLVDTLRQRVVGRPPALTAALRTLLTRFRWMFLGFSGADFSYDPHYLGILDAAPDARGFIFVARNGSPVNASVVDLVAAYGAEKAGIVFADLGTVLHERFGLRPFDATEIADAAAPVDVRGRVAEWTRRLAPMAVVNIVFAMLKSAGLDADAFWLLRRTWKSYRTPDDTSGPSYARYNLNYGAALLDAGLISNPVQRADDLSNIMEWKAAADQNAAEYLGRSYHGGSVPAGALLAAVYACRGEVARASALLSAVTERAIAADRPLDLCDVAIASIPVYDIVHIFKGAAPQLRHCLDLAKRLGDEPRRALIAAHLGRLLTYGRAYDEAEALIADAERIAARLDVPSALIASRAARGTWLAESGTDPGRGVAVLRELSNELLRREAEPLVTTYDVAAADTSPTILTGRHPMRCRIVLDLVAAAARVGDGDTMSEGLEHARDLSLESFGGYFPDYATLNAECLLRFGSDDQRPLAEQLLADALAWASESGHPWVADSVAAIRRQFV